MSALERIERLTKRLQELEEENGQLRSALDHAEYQIRTELEPRIAAENRSYDSWALNPERGM